MYLLKLALRPWRLAPMSQIFSAFTVGVLLFMVGFLFWMQQGLRSVVVRLQGEQVLTAYLEPSFPVKDEPKLMDSIRNTLGLGSGIEIQLVNSSQFVSALKKTYPDLGRELEDLGAEMTQMVPRYLSITGVLPESALDRMTHIPGIESAESSKDRNRPMVGAFSAVRWIVRVLMAGIVLALLTGLVHLSRMNATLHQDSLHLMKFWGAGRGTLLGPGLLSGSLVGLMGGAIAWMGWAALGMGFIKQVKSLSQMLHGIPGMHPHLPGVLFILGACAGVLSGVFGSLTAAISPQERGFGS